MMTSTATPTPLITTQTVLSDRFILTQVERFTLVFPAVWVAEILRLDRSQILDLPFYNPLLLGIVNHNAQITPLIAAARLLETSTPFSLKERLMVIRLNQAAGKLAHVGVVVDRAIGSSTRQELPPELFTQSEEALPLQGRVSLTPSITATELVLIRPELIPANIWQPQRWG